MKTVLKGSVRMIGLLVFFLILLFGVSALADAGMDRTAAENTALEAAGVPRERALYLYTEMETEHGRLVYDVDFLCEDLEYSYWISADDGSIVKREWELTAEAKLSRAALQGTSLIGEDQALEVALADAGLKEAEVTLLKLRLDREKTLLVYEVDFCTAKEEYEYDVDAASGVICGVDVETFAVGETVRPGQQSAENGNTAGGDALSVALSDAGLSADQVKVTKNKRDREDGVPVFEVEFVTADTKYEYEIEVETGAIREKSIEQRKASQPATSGGAVDLEGAKAIALQHAGLSADEVRFTKAKLDRDDGKMKYEIEFRKGNMEYEYEIDPDTGRILEYDMDLDD